MLNVTLALGLILFLFILLLISVLLGRWFGKRQIARKGEPKLDVVAVAEATVFALLGLLLAFTFAGAYQRFELRKLHIIEEANALETANMSLDLLAPNTRGNMRDELRAYAEANLAIYRDIPHFTQVFHDIEVAQQLKTELWRQVVAASRLKENLTPQYQVTSSFAALFEKANTGAALTMLHPPVIIYLLLISLAALGGVLVGYNTAENHEQNSIHVLSYVALTSFILYLNIDLELPRVGMIRVNTFDHILMEAKDSIRG